MQLIKLSVFDGSEEIRTIQFKDGINIITNLGETGNQIGKSTSLRALAFCLGGKSEPLWKDPDNNKVNEKVKDYLTKGISEQAFSYARIPATPDPSRP